MQHLVLYANLCFSYSPAICLSYLIYDSISFSAHVMCLPPCHNTDLSVCNYQMILTSPLMSTFCIGAFQKLVWILLNKIFNTFPIIIWVFHGFLRSIKANAQIVLSNMLQILFNLLKLIVAEFNSMRQM